MEVEMVSSELSTIVSSGDGSNTKGLANFTDCEDACPHRLANDGSG